MNTKDRDQGKEIYGKKAMAVQYTFLPQLHAREHVRYWDWMDDLKDQMMLKL